MRKLFLAILAVFYLWSATGASIHLHYCMGEFQEWGLWQKNSPTCDACGMQKSVGKQKGCCKDEHQFIKNSIDQKTVESAFQLIAATGVCILPVQVEIPPVHLSSLTEENPISNAPPRSSGVAVYILNRSFLI
ncbi:MAG TPA: hypothetical protein VLC98_00225 [Phnomibacter sp.]|nr:hypothetical protein [Phnomibacter sp.]